MIINMHLQSYYHMDQRNEEAFKVRYQTYLENATPLMDFYDKLNKLIKVDGTKDTDKKISETIKND